MITNNEPSTLYERNAGLSTEIKIYCSLET